MNRPTWARSLVGADREIGRTVDVRGERGQPLLAGARGRWYVVGVPREEHGAAYFLSPERGGQPHRTCYRPNTLDACVVITGGERLSFGGVS